MIPRKETPIATRQAVINMRENGMRGTEIVMLFYYLDIGDSGELLKIMTTLHPQYHYDDASVWGELTVSGNTSIVTVASLTAIIYMTFPCFPIYCTIIYFRKKTLKMLASSALNMSESTKKAHKKLIKALTIQALIPIFWLIAAAIFTLAEFGIISGAIPEVMTFRLMDCLPTASPMVALYFITPYRVGLLKMLSKFGIIKYGDNQVKPADETRSGAKQSVADTAADLA